jgi:hypothetical protein
LAGGVRIDFRTGHCAVVLALHWAEDFFFAHILDYEYPRGWWVTRTQPPCPGGAAARGIGAGATPKVLFSRKCEASYCSCDPPAAQCRIGGSKLTLFDSAPHGIGSRFC